MVAKAVIGPASELEKEYLVWVDGWITDEKLALLRHGLELDDRQLAPGAGRGGGPPAVEVRPQGRPQPPDPPDVRTGRADGHGPAAGPHRRPGSGRPARRTLAAADRRRARRPDQSPPPERNPTVDRHPGRRQGRNIAWGLGRGPGRSPVSFDPVASSSYGHDRHHARRRSTGPQEEPQPPPQAGAGRCGPSCRLSRSA